MTEPQEVFDILDGLSSPTADDVYQDVREYDTRHVVAAIGATAKAAGGASPLQVIGPYHITYQSSGFEGWHTLDDTIELGTIFLKAWIAVTVDWETDGVAAVVCEIGMTSDANGAGTLVNYANIGGEPSISGRYGWNEPTPTNPRVGSLLLGPNQVFQVNVQTSDSLTAGEADIYALVLLPT